MSTDSAYSGDYGYDLAHEIETVLGLASGKPPTRPGAALPAPWPEIDPDADLGYDDAHER